VALNPRNMFLFIISLFAGFVCAKILMIKLVSRK